MGSGLLVDAIVPLKRGVGPGELEIQSGRTGKK